MHSDYLLTVTEIAIALAGFAGIVLALLGARERSPEQEQLDLSLLKNVLGATFMAAGYALLPATLIEMEMDPSVTWRLSSMLFAIGVPIYILVTVPKAYRSYQLAGEPFPWTYGMNTVLGAGFSLLAVLTALGLTSESTYFLGLFFFALRRQFFFRSCILINRSLASRLTCS